VHTGSIVGGFRLSVQGRWQAWSRPGVARAARALTLAACGTLFLASAATVHIVYTIRVPYALFAVACVVGLPWVVEGWRSAPAWVRATGFALLAVYIAATIGGTHQTFGTERGGSNRDIVYLVDLVLGLATLGLIVGLWRQRAKEPLVGALAAGAGLAALYSTYQWPAQHFGWPLSDINNTLDSSGVTTGAYQGLGLLGWERVRGTFLEPHFLAAFLGALLPISVLVAWMTRERIRTLAKLGAVAIMVAMVLTASVPGWGALSMGAVVAAALYAAGRGWVGVAALLATAAVAVVVGAPVIASSPQALSAVTGRKEAQLVISSNFRNDAWAGAERAWASRPALGRGPGQSSVQLALQAEAGTRGQRVLQSAQGLWAASLVDAGVLGFGAWALFLGGLLVLGGRELYRRPSPVLLAAFAAAASVVVSSELAGDRLDTPAWALLGLLLAAATRQASSRNPNQGRQQPRAAADQRAD
jgi:hypothetical protein